LELIFIDFFDLFGKRNVSCTTVTVVQEIRNMR